MPQQRPTTPVPTPPADAPEVVLFHLPITKDWLRQFVLAATLSPSYGIYSGYESCENVPVREGSEEYLDSEKYEVKARMLAGPLLPLIGRLNEIRQAHPALQRFENLVWLDTQNDDLIAYAKRFGDDTIITVINLDVGERREGLCIVPDTLGLPTRFVATDLLTGDAYPWRTGRNFVGLEPGGSHVISVGSPEAPASKRRKR